MPTPGRDALDDVRNLRDAEAEHIDQRIARVRRLERDLAADRGDADAVAVARNAGDHAVEKTARAGIVQGSEPERIQQRDRPRAHREDVADDAADAGRRALVRFDERRMVVRLDLEDRRQAVADVDRAGVLARPLQHLRPFGRQRFQVHARALVAAVLGPHHREDPELGQVRLTTEKPHDPLVLLRLQSRAVREAGNRSSQFGRQGLRPADVAVLPGHVARSPPTITRRLPIEDDAAVDAAKQRLAGALRMRHHADHIARLIAEAGDRVNRSVRIRGIVDAALRVRVAQDHLAIGLELPQHLRRREVVAFAVTNGNPEHAAGRRRGRKRRIDLLDPHVDVLAPVLQPAIAQHRAGQQTRLEQNLKPVADAEHRSATRGERLHPPMIGEKRAMAPVLR